MRTIKFRAWDEVSKTMSPAPWELNELIQSTLRTQRFLDPKTTMWEQFTGLLDKNGKEIYENDLVQSYKIEYPSRLEVKDAVYTVEWGLFGFTLADKNHPEIKSLYLSPELLEVIGNIHAA